MTRGGTSQETRIWWSTQQKEVFGEGRDIDEDDDQHDIEDGGDIKNVYHMRLMDLLSKLLEHLGCHSAGARFTGSQR